MLMIEAVTPPTDNGLNIVTLREMKIHLRVTDDESDEDIANAIIDAADTLHGPGGVLNRTVFPTTWKRTLQRFPAAATIELPYPDLISVDAISYQNGDSPPAVLSDADYVVNASLLVGSVQRIGAAWPIAAKIPNAVTITYRAGWTVYPRAIKRAVKLLAGHFYENREATIMEARQTMINRALMFGLDWLNEKYRIPPYTDWDKDEDAGSSSGASCNAAWRGWY